MLSRTGGETFCIYKTPCGFCSRLNRDCTEDCSPKTVKNASKNASKSSEEKLLNPAEAMKRPMV